MVCALVVCDCTNGLLKIGKVLATHPYSNIAELLTSLGDKVIAPIEQKAKELEKR